MARRTRRLEVAAASAARIRDPAVERAHAAELGDVRNLLLDAHPRPDFHGQRADPGCDGYVRAGIRHGYRGGVRAGWDRRPGHRPRRVSDAVPGKWWGARGESRLPRPAHAD